MLACLALCPGACPKCGERGQPGVLDPSIPAAGSPLSQEDLLNLWFG